jgi:hypothetical protein
VLLAGGLAFGVGVGTLASGDEGDAPATVASNAAPAPQPPPTQPPATQTDAGAERRGDREPRARKPRSSASKSGAAAAPQTDSGRGSDDGSGAPQSDRRETSSERDRKPRENTASRKLETWPPGEVGYSVILLSSADRAEAKQTALDAAHADIPAGYAQSDDFTTLEPGRWIVFAGRFDSLRDAERAAQRYRRKGFDGEARLLESKAQSSTSEEPQ